MNFNTFCNICLKKDHLIKLCKEENEKTITILISVTLCPDIINNNIIYLCTICCEKLKEFDKFRKMCFTNLIHFRNLYKQMKTKLEIRNDPDITVKLKKFVDVNVQRPAGTPLLDQPADIDVAALALKKNTTNLNVRCLKIENGISFSKEENQSCNTGGTILPIPSCSTHDENACSEVIGDYKTKISQENCTIMQESNLLEHDSCEQINEAVEHDNLEEETCEEPLETSHNESVYECTECSKTFSQIRNLKVHQLIHSGEKPYKCNVCSKAFTLAHNLKTHNRIHTGERPYDCPQCQKKFTTKSQLNVHQVIHTGVRAYKCSVCKKTFARLGDVKLHEQTHSGKRPFKCSQCDKTFSCKRILKQHHQTHTGQKPFKCSNCKKAFGRLGDLKVHERIHNGERPYKCASCEQTFVYAHSLKKHQVRHKSI